MSGRHYTWRCEYVRCGKPTCGSCPHGPYWYGYWRESGRLRKKYFGRRDPRPGPDGEGAEEPHPWDVIFVKGRATIGVALAILGLDDSTSFEVARRTYRRLALEKHPDRGGDHKSFARINAAWSYLRAVRGW